MCGIAGFIGKINIEKSIIKETLNLMVNRGPDNSNYEVYKTQDLSVYLLHSRLSIIDLTDKSNQPFTAFNKTIIFNGEIYNYVEIRKQLEKKGYKFITDSDTEVLLAAFEEYGEKIHNYLTGMWAFAIWDDKKKTLFLSRDIFGEKPLYFYETNHGYYFGSEIKFLKSLSKDSLDINLNYIENFIKYGYRILNKSNETFFTEVKRIQSSHAIIINDNLSIRLLKYYTPKLTQQIHSPREVLDEVKNNLLESMRLRLRSDVPISFCLSGGVDSSGLASIAAKVFNYKIKTYSIIDTHENYNEEENILETVNDLSCEHTSINLNYSNMLGRLETLIDYHDSPISTISYLVHSLISEKISNTSSKVVISGTGADELFSGYYDHYLFHLCEFKNQNVLKEKIDLWLKFIKPLVRNKFLKDPNLYINDPERRDNFYPDVEEFSKFLKVETKTIFPKDKLFTKSILRNRLLNELFFETVPVILKEDDMNSMFYSIENRSPFLDKKLFESTLKISPDELIKGGTAKFYLRESLKGILNDKVRLDKKKVGFNASIKNIFNFKTKKTQEFFLDNSPIFDIFKKTKIHFLINKEIINETEQKFLFNFINLKIFLQKNRI